MGVTVLPGGYQLVSPAGLKPSGTTKRSGGCFNSDPGASGGAIPAGKGGDYLAREQAMGNLSMPGGTVNLTTCCNAEFVAFAGTPAAPVIGEVVARRRNHLRKPVEIQVGDLVEVLAQVVSGPVATTTFQWRNVTTPIAGATKSTFRVDAAYANLNCLVSTSNGVGGTVTAASNNLVTVLAI